MSNRLSRLGAAFALALLVSGCSLATRRPSVAELKYNPGRYQDRTVSINGVVTSSWGVGVFLLANSVVVLWKLREPIEGLQAQVLYEVCLSCNDSQAHDVLGTTLLTNLEDSRSRHRVEYPELNQNTFDAAVDALLNKGILRPGREPRSLRLGERVVEADGGWL